MDALYKIKTFHDGHFLQLGKERESDTSSCLWSKKKTQNTEQNKKYRKIQSKGLKFSFADIRPAVKAEPQPAPKAQHHKACPVTLSKWGEMGLQGTFIYQWTDYNRHQSLKCKNNLFLNLKVGSNKYLIIFLLSCD